MPWKLARLTADLNADGAWHGLALGAAGAPALSAFFHVGAGPSQAVVFEDTKIAVRAGWCDAMGSPLAGQGVALSLQPVTLDALPHPTNAAQWSERLSVGAAVTGAAWAPVLLDCGGPVGRVTVRQSAADATGVSGAARIAIWYLAR